MSKSAVRIYITGDSAGVRTATRDAEAQLHHLNASGSSALRSLAGSATFAAGALGAYGLGKGLIEAGKAAIGFDRSMRNVNSIAQLSGKQLGEIERQVLKLAGPTGQAPKVLADGLYDIVSSGFKAKDAVTILAASAKAATAGLTDTATAVKGVDAVLNAYHLKASDARKVSDVLFETVNKGVLTFGELAQQIGDVVPVASTLGVPLKDVGGALATITLHGVDAAEAATQTKQVLVSMLKPSSDLKDELKKLGYESGEAALKQLGMVGVIQKLSLAAGGNKTEIAHWFPNIRALSGFMGLAGKNVGQFTDNVTAMGHAVDGQGATAKAFAEQGKSIGVEWDKALSGLTAMAIPLVQAVFPEISAGIGDISRYIAGINGAKIGQGIVDGLSTVRDAVRTTEPVLMPIIHTLGSVVGALGGSGIAEMAVGFITTRGAILAALGAATLFNRALKSIKASPVMAALQIAPYVVTAIVGVAKWLSEGASDAERIAAAMKRTVADAHRGLTLRLAESDKGAQLTITTADYKASEANLHHVIKLFEEGKRTLGQVNAASADAAVKQAAMAAAQAAFAAALGATAKNVRKGMADAGDGIGVAAVAYESFNAIVDAGDRRLQHLKTSLAGMKKGSDDYKITVGEIAAAEKARPADIAKLALLYQQYEAALQGANTANLEYIRGEVAARRAGKTVLTGPADAGLASLFGQLGGTKAGRNAIINVSAKVDSQDALSSIADLVSTLRDKVPKSTLIHILADSKTAGAALTAILGQVKNVNERKAIAHILADTGTATQKIAELQALIDGTHGKTVEVLAKIAFEKGSVRLPSGKIISIGGSAGGSWIGGNPSAGDSVPVLVQPGEVILNRAQQAMVGPGAINAALAATGAPTIGGVWRGFDRGGKAINAAAAESSRLGHVIQKLQHEIDQEDLHRGPLGKRIDKLQGEQPNTKAGRAARDAELRRAKHRLAEHLKVLRVRLSNAKRTLAYDQRVLADATGSTQFGYAVDATQAAIAREDAAGMSDAADTKKLLKQYSDRAAYLTSLLTGPNAVKDPAIRDQINQELASDYGQIQSLKNSGNGANANGPSANQAAVDQQSLDRATLAGVQQGLGELAKFLMGGAKDIGTGGGQMHVEHLTIAPNPGNLGALATGSNGGNALFGARRISSPRTQIGQR